LKLSRCVLYCVWKFSLEFSLFTLLQTTNNDLSAQLAGSRKPGQVDTYELRSHKTRAENAERRMHNALNQLAAAEEKLASMNAKTMQVDSKWDARVKEYEQRLKAAEEKVKRERLGAKETHVQLETQIKCVIIIVPTFTNMLAC
jgi:hypothetical protein